MSNNRYEILGMFECREKQMVIVKIKKVVHVMPYDEWKWVYGKLHPERWDYNTKTK